MKKQHTLGLGNVEEGRLADRAKPKAAKVSRGGRRVKKQHTLGLGNVEEGRLAARAKPKATLPRQRKRPALSKGYKGVN